MYAKYKGGRYSIHLPFAPDRHGVTFMIALIVPLYVSLNHLHLRWERAIKSVDIVACYNTQSIYEVPLLGLCPS